LGGRGFDLRPLIRRQNHGDIKHRGLPSYGLCCSRPIEGLTTPFALEARQRLIPGPLAGLRCLALVRAVGFAVGDQRLSGVPTRSGCKEHPEPLRA
jgi:hypothetical protein